MTLHGEAIQKKKDLFLGYLKHGFLGDKVWLDASVLCQLKCPICSTGNKQTGILGNGYLSFENFRNFIDRHPQIKKIELSNWGEIFLNPDLERILEYGSSKGVALSANNGVNFNTATDAQIEALVKYELKGMLVSIDGASQPIYQIYRRGGNIDAVISNIKKVNYYKKRYQKEVPVMKWQFILFGHNEKELPAARKMAEELGMIFKVKLNGDPGYSPIEDTDQAIRETGYKSWNDQLEKTGAIRNHSCYQLWEMPVINWDGKLLGCCRNRYGHFGNVFSAGIGKHIKGEKYAYTQKMLMGKAVPRDDIPCMSCHIFEIMRSRNIYVDPYGNKTLKRRLLMRMFQP
ncbi:SPASM domain-containing protein [Desulfococcus sp.]|uniref:SPASM domain-containing protein n=1 Tax=Desulfococcus sp. TaxID=2025834 RepID=UPI0035944BDE